MTLESDMNVIKDEYSLVPGTEVWSNLAENYMEGWNFPKCIGCVNGKRVI